MRAVADRWGWKEFVKLGLVLSRGVLGLFVSAALGFGSYVLSLPVVLSIWGDVDAVVMLLLADDRNRLGDRELCHLVRPES